MTRQSFDIALEKGEYAEKIIREYLEKFGYVVYFPFTKNRAHAFDMLATLGKEKVIALDVKAKARMNKLPMTGINERTWNEYKNFSDKCNVPFKLIFVDEHPSEKRVYGNDLSELGEPDKVLNKGSKNAIYLWNLTKMKDMFSLTDEQFTELTTLSQRSYEYE